MMLNFANILAEAGQAVAVAAPEVVSADAAATPTAGGGEMLTTIIMMVAMVAVFYFLLIRPQRKKDKQVKNMLASLKPGDRICTIGGLYGTITGLRDDAVVLSLGSLKNTVVVARWAIRSVENVALENDSSPEI